MTDNTDDDMNVGRSADFARDTSLETVLAEINGSIPAIMRPPYSQPKYPAVLILGAPRSGTTLMSQWLCDSGKFAFASNLIARFHANPYFGARVQQALHTYDPGGQIFGTQTGEGFSSDLGRTKGALAPSEFWYFWRRFFKFGTINKLSDSELADVDSAGFLEGLAGLEAAQSLPIVTKAMNLNWNLPFLDQIMPNVVFVNVKRDPFFNAQSLLFARERFFDDRSRWYSFKPPEYEQLKDKPALEQVVGQIYHNRTAVEEGLSMVPDARKVTIEYSDFCTNPAQVYTAISSKMGQQGYALPQEYSGPASFKESRSIKLSSQDAEEMKRLIASYNFA